MLKGLIAPNTLGWGREARSNMPETAGARNKPRQSKAVNWQILFGSRRIKLFFFVFTVGFYFSSWCPRLLLLIIT
jgi:hypothetical protein